MDSFFSLSAGRFRTENLQYYTEKQYFFKHKINFFIFSAYAKVKNILFLAAFHYPRMTNLEAITFCKALLRYKFCNNQKIYFVKHKVVFHLFEKF
jgi:hypothetical protein